MRAVGAWILRHAVVGSLVATLTVVGVGLGAGGLLGSTTQAVASDSGTPPAPSQPSVLRGTVVVPVTDYVFHRRVGAYEGQPLGTMSLWQLEELLDLNDRLLDGETLPCPGGVGGAFDDLRRGTRVVVRDGSGRVLDSSLLTGGVLDVDHCTFGFTVRVPESAVYHVAVGRRDLAEYLHMELERTGWVVEVTL